MPSIKFKLNQEVRRVQIVKEHVGFNDLLLQAKSLFPSIGDNVSITFLWSDDEDDTVCCSTDEEVSEAFSVMAALKKTLKFDISIAEVEAASGISDREIDRTIIHDRVTCDGCGISPIVGFRFKCSVREDFDLCATCESMEIQPHPMIKIYTPDQAPAAIFVCIKEDNSESRGPHHGRWGRQGPHHGHGPHGRHGHGGPHWHGPNGPHGPRHHGPHGRPFPPHRAEMMEQRMAWMKQQCKDQAKDVKETFCEQKKAFKNMWREQTQAQFGAAPAACSPFIAAADAFVSAFAGGVDVEGSAGASGSFFSFGEAANSEPAAGVGKNDSDQSEVEQQLIDEAMRQSIEAQIKQAEESLETPVPVAQGKPVAASSVPITTVTAVVSGSTPPISVIAPKDAKDCEKLVGSGDEFPSHMSKPSKLQARFVKDVTFPDGTCIQPGSVMRKTWCIRNDGDSAWPAGCVLTYAGGDSLCSPDLTVPVPAVAIGEAVEITVQLDVPQATGRHKAYFRLRTEDGTYFGQRFWADIRVTEEEADWQVVSGLLVPAKGSGVSRSVSEEPVLSAAAAASTMGSTFDAAPGVEDLDDEYAPYAIPAPAGGATSGAAEDAATAAAAGESAAARAWERVWAKELQLLRDMGFTDTAALLPLLQQHVEAPVSLRPELNGHPAPEGMQRVVAVLLGQSGLLA